MQIRIKTELMKENLKGKVKKYEESIYNADDILTNKSRCYFNQKGNKIEYCFYDAVGILLYKNKYEYDENENRTSAELQWYEAEGSLKKTTYRYDEKGNLIFCDYSVGSYRSYEDYMYYEEENRIDVQITQPRFDSLFDKWSSSIETYKYDEKGNLIEKADDNSTLLERYKYDEKGNRTEKIKVFFTKTTYKYDAQGNLIEKYLEDTFSEKETYKNKIFTETYDYEYDAIGNWIQKKYNYIHWSNIDNCITKTKREIEYY